MDSFIVEGGRRLCGRVRVSGAKNASLPILFSTITCRGVSRIYRLPNITDVNITLHILEGLGAKITTKGELCEIDTRQLTYREPNGGDVSRLRASTYLIGSCLSRFGRVSLGSFGGCNFSPRPIDMHLSAAESFGATFNEKGLSLKKAAPCDIHFRKSSVGATVNSLILAASCEGISRIYGGAVEPHIFALVDFLRSAGAEIEYRGGCYTVRGGELRGGCITVPGDMIEAGTFLYAGLITGGRVEVEGGAQEEISTFVEPLLSHGIRYQFVDGVASLEGALTSSVNVRCAPFPSFPTDMQPILAPLLAAFLGGSITDTVFPDRFGYLCDLAAFGVKFERYNGGARVLSSELSPGRCFARDLRGGVSCVLAALCTSGRSEIMCAELVRRGYEDFVGKLRSLGASICFQKNTI